MRPDTFNIRVAPFSHSANTAGLVWRHLGCQHERMVYRPGSNPGTLNIDGSRCFNVYEGAVIEPIRDDDSLWTGFLEHLFPDDQERPAVMKWIATLIARPAVRMRYGMLLISSTQGVGKNTLGNILRILLGPKNVSFPSEASVVDSAFNGWAARKRLIFISEFYSGEKRKAYDKLKPLITEEMIEINEKGVNQFEIDNWATIIACSNSEEALHLDDEDRRWMVPVVSERSQSKEWWTRLYAWIAADGPGIVLQWALDYLEANGCVGTGDHAPASKRKTAIVERLKSPSLRLAGELAEHLAERKEPTILPMLAVREWIARQLGFVRGDGSPNIADKRLASPDKITKALKAAPGLTVWADGQRQKIGGAKQALLMNFNPAEGVEWPEIKDRVRTLEEVGLDYL